MTGSGRINHLGHMDGSNSLLEHKGRLLVKTFDALVTLEILLIDKDLIFDLKLQHA